MKNRILNNNSLEFFNASADAVGYIGPNGSNLKIFSNNGIVEIGTGGSDVQLGAVGQTVAMKWLGGGTLSSNGNSLNIGASGDVVNLNVGGVTYNFPSSIVRNTDYATSVAFGVVRVDNTTITVSGGVISAVLPANLSGGSTGAVVYQSASNTTAFLTGNTTATPQFVTSTGTGSAAQAPTLTGSTGTGSVVLATSPSITTSLTTASTSFNLLNTTATTVNAFGAATAISIGASTGTTTVNNNFAVTGAFTGNIIFGTVPTSPNNLYTIAPLNLNNSGASGTVKTQLNLINTAGGGGAGSAIDFYTYLDTGNSVPGSRLSSVDDGSYSANIVFQTKGQTANGALSTKFTIGSTGIVTLTSDIVGIATQNVFNTTSTTVNAFGASTATTLGAATGTFTVNSITLAHPNATSLTMNGASPSITTTSTGTASVFNTNALTGNLFGAATTVSIGASTGTTTVNNNLTVTGNLTVNGSTEYLNSTTLQVLDKNIEIGKVATPTDVTADGGGITLKGATDKTIVWDSTNTNWTSSENWNLATGKVYKINNVSVLSATQVLGKTIGGTSTGDIVSIDGTQTLTNKSISLGSNTITGTLAQLNTAITDADIAAATHKYHEFTLNTYYYDSYAQERYFRLFTQNATYDTARYSPVTNVEYWNGTAWVTWTGGDAIVKNLLDGRDDTYADIDHTHKKFRFTINKNSGWPTNAIIATYMSWYGNGWTPYTLTIEDTADQVTWTTKETLTFGNTTNTNADYGWHAFYSGNLHNGRTLNRITYDITDWTDSSPYFTKPIYAFSIFSNYNGASDSIGVPVSWNYDKIVNFSAIPTVSSVQVATLTASQTLTNKTLSTGVVYNGGVISGTYGGTGVNNGSNTITIAGNVSHAGAFTQTFTATGNTSVTLPTTGTLLTTTGSGSSLTFGTGSLSLAGNLTTSGAFTTTLTATANTTVTLPTTGTLATTGNLSQFAATTSAQLAGVISDETGSGALVFGTSPSITTSLTTSSGSFDLINTTVTTVNFAKAATALSIGASTGTTTVNNDLTVTGNLTVNGTTEYLNSTTIQVADKNIELGKVTTPTDATADGGGITLKGATDKTIIWDQTNTNWTSSENWNLVTGKTFKINNVGVLSSTQVLGKTIGGTSAGDIVSIDGAQTLTNKTLSSATLTGTVTAGGGVGTSGQVLSSTGTGVQWINAGGSANAVLYTSQSLSTAQQDQARSNIFAASPDDAIIYSMIF